MPQDSFDFRFCECCVGLFKTSYDSAPINIPLIELYIIFQFLSSPFHDSHYFFQGMRWPWICFAKERLVIVHFSSGQQIQSPIQSSMCWSAPQTIHVSVFRLHKGKWASQESREVREVGLAFDPPFLHFMPPISSDFSPAVKDGTWWMINICHLNKYLYIYDIWYVFLSPTICYCYMILTDFLPVDTFVNWVAFFFEWPTSCTRGNSFYSCVGCDISQSA